MGNKIKIDRVCLLQHKHINYITCDSLMKKKRPTVGTLSLNQHMSMVAALTRTLPYTHKETYTLLTTRVLES